MTMPDREASSWLLLAIASGACAACNGVFAKLTTTELTTSWSHSISGTFHLSPSNKLVEYGIRGIFFALNLLFNAIMWGLFTRALTLASSTVRVSVINTSANFMLTAILGTLIFSESLPGLWWLGAAMLVAGSVIIGRRDEGGAAKGQGGDIDGEGTDGERARFLDEDGAEEGDEELELGSVKGDEDEDEEAGSSGDEDGVLK